MNDEPEPIGALDIDCDVKADRPLGLEKQVECVTQLILEAENGSAEKSLVMVEGADRRSVQFIMRDIVAEQISRVNGRRIHGKQVLSVSGAPCLRSVMTILALRRTSLHENP